MQTTSAFTFAATGGLLSRIHVDANRQAGLNDGLGRAWFSSDARGFVAVPAYDAMHRSIETQVALRGRTSCTVESRVAFGESMPADQARSLNLRGRARQVFGQQGWSEAQGASLSGAPLATVRFLSCHYAGRDDGMPAVAIPPLSDSCPKDAGLQAQGYTEAAQRADAWGRMLETVTTLGHVLQHTYRLSGLPEAVAADGTVLLSAIVQNARGQIASVAKGSVPGGEPVFTAVFRYDPRNHLPKQRYASTSPDTASQPCSPGDWIDGSTDPGRRQDLRYAFDPNGNVCAVSDAYPVIVFGACEAATSAYGYDAMYRLLTANGMETSDASPVDGIPGIPAAAHAVGFDAAALAPYRQSYTYDIGGNMAALNHFSNGAPCSDKSAARKISKGSNRSISADWYRSLGGTGNGIEISESFFSEAGLFDACGNQLANRYLPSLAWNYRNQTSCIRYPDPGDAGQTVSEYSVDAGGARSRKVVETRNAEGTLTRLETVDYFGDAVRRASYVQADAAGIAYDGETVGNAIVQSSYSELRIGLGHAQQARILSGALADGAPPASRTWYSLSDQIDSCQTELAADGSIDGHQAFYPYGGTAISAANDTQADSSLALKERQYSGEEKDGSGVYYYGFRRNQPYEFCWLSPDPSGFAGSGLNWYRMVNGNPVTYRDALGLMWTPAYAWQGDGDAKEIRAGNRAAFERDFPRGLVDHWMFCEDHEFGNEAAWYRERYDTPDTLIPHQNYTSMAIDEFRASAYIDHGAYVSGEGKISSHIEAVMTASVLRQRQQVPIEILAQFLHTRHLAPRPDGSLRPFNPQKLLKPFLKGDKKALEKMKHARDFFGGITTWAMRDKRMGRTGASWMGASHALASCATPDPRDEDFTGYPEDFELLERICAAGIRAVAIMPFPSAHAYDADDHEPVPGLPETNHWKHFYEMQRQWGRRVMFYNFDRQSRPVFGFFAITPRGWTWPAFFRAMPSIHNRHLQLERPRVPRGRQSRRRQRRSE